MTAEDVIILFIIYVIFGEIRFLWLLNYMNSIRKILGNSINTINRISNVIGKVIEILVGENLIKAEEEPKNNERL